MTTPSELVHLDRLVFGTSQYFVFQDPAKVAPNQPYYDFEAMQDEIGRESGLINKDNNQNMTKGSHYNNESNRIESNKLKKS